MPYLGQMDPNPDLHVAQPTLACQKMILGWGYRTHHLLLAIDGFIADFACAPSEHQIMQDLQISNYDILIRTNQWHDDSLSCLLVHV